MTRKRLPRSLSMAWWHLINVVTFMAWIVLSLHFQVFWRGSCFAEEMCSGTNQDVWSKEKHKVICTKPVEIGKLFGIFLQPSCFFIVLNMRNEENSNELHAFEWKGGCTEIVLASGSNDVLCMYIQHAILIKV